MKKRILSMFAVLSILCFNMACANAHVNKSYTFNVDTGDAVKVTLDISEKYDITSDLPFEISCDGEALSQGSFITTDGYEQYVDVVNTDEDAVLLDEGTKDGNQYLFWSYNNEEYNYAILIENANTGVVLGNAVSKTSAEECFKRLTITVEE